MLLTPLCGLALLCGCGSSRSINEARSGVVHAHGCTGVYAADSLNFTHLRRAIGAWNLRFVAGTVSVSQLPRARALSHSARIELHDACLHANDRTTLKHDLAILDCNLRGTAGVGTCTKPED